MGKKNLPPAVQEWYAEIGRKNGKKLMEERGPEYFSRIASMRKKHGRQKPVEEVPLENENS